MVTCEKCGTEFGTVNAVSAHSRFCPGSKKPDDGEKKTPSFVARLEAPASPAVVAADEIDLDERRVKAPPPPTPPNIERPPQYIPRMPMPSKAAMPAFVAQVDQWIPPRGWHDPTGEPAPSDWHDDAELPQTQPGSSAEQPAPANDQSAGGEDSQTDSSGETGEREEPGSALIKVIDLWIDANDMRPLSTLERGELVRYVRVSPPEWIMPYVIVGGIIGGRILDHPIYGPAIAEFASWVISEIRGWFSSDEDDDEEKTESDEVVDHVAASNEARVVNDVAPAVAPGPSTLQRTPASKAVIDVKFEDVDPVASEDAALFARATQGD